MIKWLLTIAIVVIALMLWFGKGRGGGAASQRRRTPGPEAMVSCAHCGLHLPRPDALEGEGGRHYCSVEHRRLGPGASG
ncbi:MAG TPA: PP0621 family protein [Ideonella sp.]|uniref:PP0621 family protein n=1 Tax=Ideonella sp. TaxID=1929293 RepID=UPI002E331A61|nr:PP0621 family protein [Ideonella sp.]HEX5686363.1 PP0621 family protein [Ideonella sp.]